MSFYVAVNPIGPEGIRTLMTGLTQSSKVTYLNFSNLIRQLHDWSEGFRIFEGYFE